MGPILLGGIWLGLMAACDGTPQGAGSAGDQDALDAAGLPADGWPAQLAGNSTGFSAMMEREDRAGWIAFQGAAYPLASERLSGWGGHRARIAEAALRQDLALSLDLAWQRTSAAWKERSGIPAGSALPVIAALAALDGGRIADAQSWLEMAGTPADADIVLLAHRLEGLEDLDAIERGGATDGPVGCVLRHLEAREAGDLALLGECASRPLVEEKGSNGTRVFYDPLLHRTQAIVAAMGTTQPEPPGEEEGQLSWLLFSGTWSPGDAASEWQRDASGRTVGAQGATLASLDLPPPSARSGNDDGEWARERVRALDSHLDAWETTALNAASTEGGALLKDLAAVRIYRVRVLLAWARQALSEDRPLEAEAFSRLAVDVEHSREVGATNPPGLYAVLATALLKTGRSREALDALEVLATHDPSIRGLDETVGDLAVLEGLGRPGDSKEN